MTKGFPIGRFLADRKRMDLLVTSSCIFELSMNFVYELSFRERRTMAVRKLVSIARNLGI